ncbi:hypothetical protein M436DRAFT_69327 [Aureobasidium namibiae CBS 147.97]|uniref:Uncharacterized protein n=1 Tax=Aureobasidium namibiae CBS 147.97 TaxID=1043004 RepID=A0A074XUB3_9PEZI|nr:uncharacterized protein M436DRAFT_69327 [Aureobasidium namibiae CBS 147.97]KEQ78211.1 hypothetical protein M436DRAFT_69327 [Aureobasidium namibiae CBS 147.97]
MATPAVVRDNFVYNDAFFAQVDENKRHPRASVAELTLLLRPETSSTPPAKDQVGHWYQAQLVRYGLQPSKDKNTAKVRLLQAINANTLSVPAHVTKLEKDMKKEFTAAVKKTKISEKAPTAPAKSKKRTHEEATTNTKITLTVGGVSITVDQQTAASITSAVADAVPAAKKTKVVKNSAAISKAKLDKNDAPTVKPKKSAQNAESTKFKPSATINKPAKENTPAKLQTESAEVKPQKKDAPAKAKAIPKPKDPPAAAKPKAELEPKKPAERNTSEAPSQSDKIINGTYLLHLRSHSPANVPEFNGPPRISIHHNIHTDKLWGHFVIGPKTGVIRVDEFCLDGPRTCSFNWRARDMGSGQLRFGRGCEGVMEFGIHGVDKGTFYRLFDGIDVDFGTSNIARDTQMDWPEWMDQWEHYVKEAYNR